MTIDEAREWEAELRADGYEPVQAQLRYRWMIAQANIPWLPGVRVHRNSGGVERCLWVADAAATIIMSGFCECERVRLLQQGQAQWGAIATGIVLGRDQPVPPHCRPRHKFEPFPRHVKC